MSYPTTIKVYQFTLVLLPIKSFKIILIYLFQQVILSANLTSTKLILFATNDALFICRGQTHPLTKLVLILLLRLRSCLLITIMSTKVTNSPTTATKLF